MSGMGSGIHYNARLATAPADGEIILIRATIVSTLAWAFVLVLAVHWGAAQAAANAKSDRPEVRSNAALVVDANTSAVLFARKPNQAAPIASITKLMTALVVMDARQPLDELVQITDEDRKAVRGTPSRLGVGVKLTRADLLHVALMSSDNRAAHALGRSYPGGTHAFVQAMNAKAKTLGMSHSSFADATGLSSDNVASPSDLARLVVVASRDATIRRFSTDPNFTVAVGRGVLEFRNTNYLVGKDDWDIELQKTGYTDAAGQCLVMKTVIDNQPLVIVLLDSFGKHTRTADARRIRRWLQARSQPASTRTAAIN